MLTKGELDTFLSLLVCADPGAWRLFRLVLSSKPTPALERDLTVAVRALERAYSAATP